MRDLAWSCLGAPLFNTRLDQFDVLNPCEDHRATTAWLKALDSRPQSLIEHLECSKHSRLGLYFEDLLQFLWTEGFQDGATPYQSLNHNLAIHQNGTTLGEMDFLLSNNCGLFWHLETAVKFYLLQDNIPQQACHWCHWLGPNARDRLDIKLGHLTGQQLSRSSHPAATEVLRLQGISSETITPVHWLRGIFFYPLQNWLNADNATGTPKHANNNHEQGFWLRSAGLAQLEQAPVTHWYKLPRKRWLAGMAHDNSASDALEFKELQGELQEHFYHQDTSTPIMLEPVNREGRQFARVMIVRDSWPHTSCPRNNSPIAK